MGEIFFPYILAQDSFLLLWFMALKGFPSMSYRQEKRPAEFRLDPLVLKMSFGWILTIFLFSNFRNPALKARTSCKIPSPLLYHYWKSLSWCTPSFTFYFSLFGDCPGCIQASLPRLSHLLSLPGCSSSSVLSLAVFLVLWNVDSFPSLLSPGICFSLDDVSVLLCIDILCICPSKFCLQIFYW